MKVHLKLAGVKLDKKDVLGYSDPYFEIWTSDTAVGASDDDGDGGDGTSSGTFTKVHKSEVIKMTLNPAWTPIDINLDPTKPLFFKVWDWDRIGSHDFIGATAETTVGDLLALPALPLINPKKMPGGKKHKAGYTDSGVLHIQIATVAPPPPRPPPAAAAIAANAATSAAAAAPVAPGAPAPAAELAPAAEGGKAGAKEGAKEGATASKSSFSATNAKVPPPSKEALAAACTALNDLFAAKHKFVSDKVAAGQVPSPGDLAAFLRQCVTDVQPHARLLASMTATGMLSHSLLECFVRIGWNARANTSMPGSKPPSVEAVLGMLTKARALVGSHLAPSRTPQQAAIEVAEGKRLAREQQRIVQMQAARDRHATAEHTVDASTAHAGSWATVRGSGGGSGGGGSGGGGSGGGSGSASGAPHAGNAAHTTATPLAASQVVLPTGMELASVAAGCNKLWELDEDRRLIPFVDYEIDLQHGKKSYQTGDFAPGPLFKMLSPTVLERPTYKAFYDLLDNYEREAGVAETVTREEKAENTRFINLVMETRPMKYCHAYLAHHKKVPRDEAGFKQWLHNEWFGLYRRESRNDSSGFEHVFVGEERDGKVMGMHNWLQIYLEERAGRFDYKGYIKPRPSQRGGRTMDPEEWEQMVTISFDWEGDPKPVSTSFVGTSPQFELALYSLCFGMGKESYSVKLGPYNCIIKAYKIGHGRHAKIGTSFPEARPMTPDQAATLLQANFRRVNEVHKAETSGKPLTKSQKKNAARRAARKKKKKK